jgi:hypothetical protein
MRLALFGLALLLTTLAPTASQAELIRSSTGYPSTAWTNERPALGATIGAGPGGGFVVTSARLNPTSDVVLTEMRGIGFATLFEANVHNFDWEWDLHSSLQHAIDFPFQGDIFHSSNVPLASGPTVFGTSGGKPTYLVSFDLSPYDVTLDGGIEYWSTFAAISVTGADGFWGWQETVETGPSDIGRDDTGAWVYWSDVPGHSTGRAAQDYFVQVVPEPSGLMLCSLAMAGVILFAAARGRSR